MARTRRGKRRSDSYTIRATNQVIRGGDFVLMRASEPGEAPYVAKIQKIKKDKSNNVAVRVRWYYRPEESILGRREFLGLREVFWSNHRDTQSALTIERKCNVHTLKKYRKIGTLAPYDFYSRFNYYPSTGTFKPDTVILYCTCETPYNPDFFMLQCDGACKDWFHPDCVNIPIQEAQKLKRFKCPTCSSNGALSVSPRANGKVEPKRRKKKNKKSSIMEI